MTAPMIQQDTIAGTALQLGDSIARRMSVVGLGIGELARETGIGAKSISQTLEGRADIPLDHMLRLLHRIGMDMRLPRSLPGPADREEFVKRRLYEVGAMVRQVRRPAEGRKISLKAISDSSGIEQGQIGKIERGHVPRFRTFLALARALNVQVRFEQRGGQAAPDLPSLAPNPKTLRRGRRKAAVEA